MKPIVRPTPKPTPPRTRVLLIRPAGGVKSVRARDQADRTPLRLAIGVIVAIGVVAAVWLMGYLGFRLGFAPLIDVPQLQIGFGGGLVTGTLMLVSIPPVIILAGMAKPTWLMLGFVLIAIPAAGISAAKPRSPGGPRPSSAALTFSYAGAIGAALNTLLMIWWIASETRNVRIDQLRVDPLDLELWLENLVTVAGMDVLAVVASALWVVLVMRLPIPLWLRALAASASFFTLVVMTVAMSMSNAASAQLQKARSEVFLADGCVHTRLLLGSTPHHMATLRVDKGVAVIELHDRSGTLTVMGRKSIVDMLREEAKRQQRGP